MTIKPSKIVYDIGRDQHQRPLALTIKGDSLLLRREAVNQRDVATWVSLNMVEAQVLAETLAEFLKS